MAAVGDGFFQKARVVSDDRLRLVPLLDASVMKSELPHSLRRQLEYAAMDVTRMGLVYLVAFVGGGVALSVIFGSTVSVRHVVVDAVSVGVVWLIVTVVVSLNRSRLERRGVAELKRLARCASCGYHLRGLAPEPDGCVVCPECAAAWRLPA